MLPGLQISKEQRIKVLVHLRLLGSMLELALECKTELILPLHKAKEHQIAVLEQIPNLQVIQLRLVNLIQKVTLIVLREVQVKRIQIQRGILIQLVVVALLV